MATRIDRLTDEQQARIPEWNQRWIKIITATGPTDRKIAARAVAGMYAAAKLKTPRIIFVPSPLVAAIAGSISAGIWWLRSEKGTDFASRHLSTDAATYAATDAATRAATYAATYGATYAATDAATDAATRAATYAATDAATYAATDAATRAATYGATYGATYAATDAATDAATYAATRAATVRFLLGCCGHSLNNMNGGNQWASWCGFLSFWRDVCGLMIEAHAPYAHYEDLAIHSGWRYLHSEFCLIADRPVVFNAIERNGVLVPHCETGPTQAWSDGWSLWHIEGVRVDEQIVLRPETQSVTQIKREPNEEIRRVRIERFGWERYLRESGARIRHQRRNDRDAQDEHLYQMDDGSQRFVCVDPSTGRKYALGVPREIDSCESAQHWMSSGLDRFAIHRS